MKLSRNKPEVRALRRQRAAEVVGFTPDEREFDPRSEISTDDHHRYVTEIQKLDIAERLRATLYYVTLFPEQASAMRLEEQWKEIEPMLGIVQGEMRAWCIALFPGRCDLLPAEQGKSKTELLFPQLLPQQKKLVKREESHIQQFAGVLAAYEREAAEKEEFWKISLRYLGQIRQQGRGDGYVKAYAWLRLVDVSKVVGLEPTSHEYGQAVGRLRFSLEHERSWEGTPEQWFPQSLEHAFSLFVLSADIQVVKGSLGRAVGRPNQGLQPKPLPDRLTA